MDFRRRRLKADLMLQACGCPFVCCLRIAESAVGCVLPAVPTDLHCTIHSLYYQTGLGGHGTRDTRVINTFEDGNWRGA